MRRSTPLTEGIHTWHRKDGASKAPTGQVARREERTVARVLVFDVNETLLDLRALREPFGRAFGDASPLGEWFARLLHGSLVATLTDAYEDFGTMGRRALDALAVRRGVALEEKDRDAILGTMRRLPAHPEVPEALARLRSAGVPLAALTNSSAPVALAQL